MAVHSLSKRSNLAGLRVGFYAGDPELVEYLAEVRQHAGLMVPGPVQAAAAVALDDDDHVEAQRAALPRRLERLAEILRSAGLDAALPGGRLLPVGPGAGLGRGAGPRPRDDAGAWVLTDALAEAAGMLVSPGEFYGDGRRRVRPDRRGPARRPHRAGRPRAWRSSDHPLLGRSVARGGARERGRRPVTSADGRPASPRSKSCGRVPASSARPTPTRWRIVTEAIDLLDRGEARVAEVDADTGEVVVHSG